MLNNKRFPVLLSLAILVASASSAQQRRLLVKVTDVEGAPLQGVKVGATSPDTAAFKSSAETNAKGEFVMMVLAESVSAVTLRMDKEGFVPAESEVELTGSKTQREFKLESIASRQAAEAAQRGPDAAEIHNAGAEAAKAGDWKTAAEKFAAALAVKEDIYQTHSALATALFNLGDFTRSETSARRSLELNPSQPEMLGLLSDSLDKLGRKAEADVYRNKLAEGDPKLKAVLAFNRGAELANQKKDTEAVAAFEEAVAADPDLAVAHYNLGLTAFRVGDMAKAKKHLDRFLALDPANPNAKTASAVLAGIPSPKAGK